MKGLHHCFYLIVFIISSFKNVPTNQLRAVSMESASYARIPLTSFLSSIQDSVAHQFWLTRNSSKQIESIRVAFTPLSENGILLFIDMDAESQTWIGAGLERGRLAVYIGKNKQKTIRILFTKQIAVHQQIQFLKISIINLQVILAINGNKHLTVKLPDAFHHAFVVNNQSEIHLGKQFRHFKDVPLVFSMSACLHQVAINDRLIEILEGGTQLYKITPCPKWTASDCDSCGRYGICKKTVNCNNDLKVKEAAFDGIKSKTVTNSPQLHMDTNMTVQCLELQFDAITFLNSISIYCNSTSRNGNGTKNSFFLQFATNGRYFNYTENQKTKVFNLQPFLQAYYLAWPVSIQSVKIRFIGKFDKICSWSVLGKGCNKTDFRETALGFLPPHEWTPIFQAPLLKPIDNYLLQFGEVNEELHQKRTPGEFEQQGLVYKGKLFDILEAFTLYQMYVKVEFLNSSTLHTASSWVLNLSACNSAFDKLLLTKLIQNLNIFANHRSEPLKAKCHWTQLKVMDTNITDNNTIMKVSIQRSYTSLDAFKIIHYVVMKPAVASSSPLTLSSVEECARICLASVDPVCTAFSITWFSFQPPLDDSNQNRYKCLLAAFDVVESDIMLDRNAMYSTYILSERFRSHLPLIGDNAPRINLAAVPDLGFQCQCMNQMVGARCDNISLHDYTYHVIVTSPSDRIELNCQVDKNTDLVIEVHFALLGSADDITSTHFPFDLHDEVISTLRIVQAICNGRQSTAFAELCNSRPVVVFKTISESLLLPRRYSYLEVRYVCTKPQETSVSYDPLLLHKMVTKENVQKETSKIPRVDADIVNEVIELEKQDDKTDSETLLFDMFEMNDQPTIDEQEVTTSASVAENFNPTHDILPISTRVYPGLVLSTATSTNSVMLTSTYETTKFKNDFDVTTLDAVVLTPKSSPTSNSCPKTKIKGLQFPKSFAGSVTVKCPPGTLGDVTLLCFANGTWSRDLNGCTPLYLGSISNMIENAYLESPSPNITALSLAQFQYEALESLNKTTIQPKDIEDNIKLVERLLLLQKYETKMSRSRMEIVLQSSNLTKSIQQTVNTLLDEKLLHVWNQMEQHTKSSAAFNLTNAVDDVGFYLASKIEKEENLINHLENIIFQISTIRNTSGMDGINHLNFHSHSLMSSMNDSDWSVGAVSIAIPFRKENNQTNDFVFAVYKNMDALLGSSYKRFYSNESSILKNLRTINDSKDFEFEESETKGVINSYVISAKTKPVSENLFEKNKIKMIFRHKAASKNNARCVFWKEQARSSFDASEEGYWSDKGCAKVKSNNTHTECECVHLTHFAILMDVVGVQLDEKHELALSVITWVGCSLSAACLLLCLICFNTLRGVRKIRNTIHKNLSFTLMLAQIIFLSGIDKTDWPILCPIIAGTLHYLFLVVFAWMCVEGLHIYASLVQVFEIDKPSRLFCYYIFSYGFPTVVVAVSVALRHDGYGTKRSCWLAAQNDNLIWSFVGPALTVMGVNIFFFFIALRVMHTHRISSPPNHTRFDEARMWIKGSFVLLSLLGITWIFGIFFVNGRTVVMAYFFTACNAFQGIFIFVFHCIMNERVRTELTKNFRRSKLCPTCVQRRYRMNSMNANTRSACIRTNSIALKVRRSSSSCQDSMSTVAKSWCKLTPDIEIKDHGSFPSSNIPRNCNGNKDTHQRLCGVASKKTSTQESTAKDENMQCTRNQMYMKEMGCFGGGRNVELKQRNERFHRDGARQFECTAKEEQSGNITNKTLPFEGRGRPELKKAIAIGEIKQHSSSLLYSMDLSVNFDNLEMKKATILNK